MKRLFNLLLIIAIVSLTSCETLQTQLENNYSLKPESVKLTQKSTLKLTLVDQGTVSYDSIAWTYNGKIIPGMNDKTFSASMQDARLGAHTYGVYIYKDDAWVTKKQNIYVLAQTAPKLMSYNVVATYPHDSNCYTQGLEFHNGKLYESAGKYQESNIRITNVETGEVEKFTSLDVTNFGEGLTIVGNQVYQLTWMAQKGFIYDLDLNLKSEFYYQDSTQGWGLTHDDQYVYKSDGSSKIWKLDPNTLEEIGYIEVVTNNELINKVNELEMIDGKIYANLYTKESIAIINPETGVLETIIDMRGLKKQQNNERAEQLNGIALNPDTGKLYVTGKYWDTMFEIEIVEKQ